MKLLYEIKYLPASQPILNFTARIKIRLKFWLGLRFGLEWYLGLGCSSIFQYGGRVWVKIFPQMTSNYITTDK